MAAVLPAQQVRHVAKGGQPHEERAQQAVHGAGLCPWARRDLWQEGRRTREVISRQVLIWFGMLPHLHAELGRPSCLSSSIQRDAPHAGGCALT